MQVNIELLSSVKKKLNFEIPVERVNAEIEKVFEDIRKRATLPGFRKGKAPKSLLEKHYQGQIEGDVIKNLFSESYFKYIQDNKIFPVAYPEIESDDLVKGEPFKFSAVVEVFPEVKVHTYEKLAVKREKFTPDAEVVEKRLQQMRESMAQLQPVEDGRSAQTGDLATIDFVGYLDGEPFANGAGTDYRLELGSGSFIPGFEEQVAGMNVGEEKRIALKFPENYHSKELAGKDVEFAVTLKELKAKELPELTDEFAKEFGEFQTLEELRAKIQETYLKQENDRIDHEFKDRLVLALVEANDFEVPGALVEKQLAMMLENTQRRLQLQNLSMEMMGMDEARYREQFRGMAEQKVKGSLLLDSLAEQEKITVGDEELEARVRQMAADSGQDYERIAAFYLKNSQARENLLEQVKEEKVIALLCETAVVDEVDRIEQ
jgi:trigger factor